MPNTPKRPDVAGIEARAKAATEGPWKTVTDTTGHRNTFINAPHSFVCTLDLPRGPARKANAEFIAHARQDIPALIAHIKVLEAQKWDIQHTDAMNDMVALGIDRDSWKARVEALEAVVEAARDARPFPSTSRWFALTKALADLDGEGDG